MFSITDLGLIFLRNTRKFIKILTCWYTRVIITLLTSRHDKTHFRWRRDWDPKTKVSLSNETVIQAGKNRIS